MLLKSCPVSIKAVGESDGLGQGQFRALVSVFGNKDSYGDVMMKGSFANTLDWWREKGDPIPVYWSHRMEDPDFNIGEVLNAVETDAGLEVLAQLDMDDAALKAKQVFRLLKGRRVTQFSFAYDVVHGKGAESEQFGEYFQVDEVKLYEVGPTPIGANQSTELLGVKSFTEQMRRFAGEVKAGRVLSSKNETTLREAQSQISAAAQQIADVLSVVESNNDQEKASGKPAAKSETNVEEPPKAKTSVSDEEPTPSPSVNRLLSAQAHIYALTGAQEGVPS